MGERPAPEPARASAPGSAAEPGPATARAAAPAWIQQATGDSFSWSQALGGPRGVVESVAPGLVFVVVYALTRSLVWTLAAALGVALMACAARLPAPWPWLCPSSCGGRWSDWRSASSTASQRGGASPRCARSRGAAPP